MLTPMRALFGALVLTLISVVSFAGDSSPAPCGETTPPADWEAPAGDTAEDVLGGKVSSKGVASVKNNGKGHVRIQRTNDAGTAVGDSVDIAPGQTKSIVMEKDEKLNVESKESKMSGKDAEGTVTFTPSCKSSGQQQPV